MLSLEAEAIRVEFGVEDMLSLKVPTHVSLRAYVPSIVSPRDFFFQTKTNSVWGRCLFVLLFFLDCNPGDYGVFKM